MFEAVKEANDAGTTVWAIGVDSDQGSEANAGVPNDVKPYILTSMIKRVDVAVFETIRDVNEGDFDGGRAGPSTSPPTASATRRPAVTSTTSSTSSRTSRQQIIDGEIEVPDTPAG